MLFVTHDFGVVAQLCDSITVMYAGQTVEARPDLCRARRSASSLYAGPARLPPGPLGYIDRHSRSGAVSPRAAPRLPLHTPLHAGGRGLQPAHRPARSRCPGTSRRLPPRRRAPSARRMSLGEPILETRDLVVLLRRSQAMAAAGRAAGARRGRRDPVAAGRARRWGWSASWDAARPRSGAHCSASSAKARARSASTARIVSGLPREQARRARSAVQYVHQDAGAALDPWWSIGSILEEG